MTNNDCPEIDYYAVEQVFPAFWEANIKGDYSCFDFDEAFDGLKGFFYEKLIGHGVNGVEDCKEHWDMMLGGINGEAFKDFAIDNPWISISKEELLDAVLEHICNRYRETFEEDPIFMDLKKTYDKMLSPPQEEKEKAILMDRVINSIHHTEGMWENQADVETLKTEFEENIAREIP